jgi:short subunit dehydrogenase-like uncharacterized protein
MLPIVIINQNLHRYRASKNDFIVYRAVGISDENSATPRKALLTTKYDGSMYLLTGVLLSEAAITILRDETAASKLGGGVLTPATLGQPFIDRLAKVGYHTEIEIVKGGAPSKL